ncbi:MAG TPA: hypothetical protein VFQ16_12665 [Burkholderiaceae bacterium]|nr:hypothetical protein [Burkholderiaceae bacterium]
MAKVPPQVTSPFHGAGPALPQEAAAPLPVGAAVGGYVIEAVLHEGPHGHVYRARDAAGQPCALKEFFPRGLAVRREDGTMRARQPADAIRLSVALQAFRDESQALSGLRQRGLVEVRETVEAWRTLFRVMPLLEGVTLAQHVAQRAGVPDAAEVAAFVTGLMGPLGALHASGVVHGNVRPEQILLPAGRGAGMPVLLGLGTVAEEIDGPPRGPWTAPERGDRLRGGRVTSAADLYALAACAWFLATGERPPSADERAEGDPWRARDGFEALRDADGGRASAVLAQALEAALSMAPEARPQRVGDLQRLLDGKPSVRLVGESAPAPLWVGETPDRDAQRGDIEQFAVRADDAAPTAPMPRPAGPAAGRSRTRWLVLALIAVAGAGLLIVLRRLAEG